MYKALTSTLYYGLLRIGELATGDHPVKLEDIYVADNKKKAILVLRTSKTHTLADKPQKITIGEADAHINDRDTRYCPFYLLNNYFNERLTISNYGPLFVFLDGSPVKPEQFRFVLKTMIKCVV